MKLFEVFLKIYVSFTFSTTDRTYIRFRWIDDTFAFEDVEVFTFTALVENPLREMNESVAVGVSGDVGYVAETFGEVFER